MTTQNQEHTAKPVNPWKKWIGLTLVFLAGVWFACIFVVPFMGISLALKATLGTVFFALMEGTFYLGVFLVGKKLLSRYWSSIKQRLHK